MDEMLKVILGFLRSALFFSARARPSVLRYFPLDSAASSSAAVPAALMHQQRDPYIQVAQSANLAV